MGEWVKQVINWEKAQIYFGKKVPIERILALLGFEPSMPFD